MVQILYKNWLLVPKITWGIWDNFRQAVESPKRWNLMVYFCPKNTFLQLNHYEQRVYLISSVISETTSHFSRHNSSVFLVQRLHTFYKRSLPKCKFSDFPLLGLKFTKFLMSFFKQKVSFSSKFGSLFSVMRDNSSALF